MIATALPEPPSRGALAMSADTEQSMYETRSARYALEDAENSIRRARLDLQDMHQQVSAASRSLSDVERRVRSRAVLDPSEAMTPVARRSREAGDFGIEVATHLRNARQHIAAARDHAGKINTGEMTAPEVADVADLRARIDAYGQAVDLAGPMATASSEHLYSASDLAARAGAADPNAIERQDAAYAAAVASDLSRAQEAEAQLGRTVEMASDMGQRSLTNPQMEMSVADDERSTHNEQLLDVPSGVPERVEAEQIYPPEQGDRRPTEEPVASRDANEARYDVLEGPQVAGRRAAEEAQTRMAEEARRVPAPTGDPAPRVQGPRR